MDVVKIAWLILRPRWKIIMTHDGKLNWRGTATIDSEVVRGHMYKYKSLYILQAGNPKKLLYIDDLQLTPALSVDHRHKPDYLKLKEMPEVVPCE